MPIGGLSNARPVGNRHEDVGSSSSKDACHADTAYTAVDSCVLNCACGDDSCFSAGGNAINCSVNDRVIIAHTLRSISVTWVIWKLFWADVHQVVAIWMLM